MSNPKGFFLLCYPNGNIESIVKDDLSLFQKNGSPFYEIFKDGYREAVVDLFMSAHHTDKVQKRTLSLKQNAEFSKIEILTLPIDERVAVVGAATEKELEAYYHIIDKLLPNRTARQVYSPREASEPAEVFNDSENNRMNLLALREKLNSKQAELVEKNKELDQFAHIISHDLKAPLSQSKLIVHLLKKKMDLAHTSPEVTQLFEMLILSTNHMSGLIDSINAYAKSGNSEKLVSEFLLQELYDDILSKLNPPPQMVFHLPDYLPLIKANRAQLEQILTHLVNNAIRFHHLAKGEITFTFDELVDQYRFGVKDNGPGIPDEYHQSIYQIFNQVHRKNRNEGAGVGLSIVKKLVENAGGQLSLDSKVGSGSYFYFTCPKGLI